MPLPFVSLRGAANRRKFSARNWGRRLRLLAAWLAALLLCSGLIWAITWFRPQQSVALVLVGAGYEENLAVPHNAYGWQSLIDLHDAYDQDSDAAANYVVAGPPQTIDSALSWKVVLDSQTERTLALIISAHGAADGEGPYLLPNDYHGSKDQRLRLDALWNELERLPSDQQKLILLDVTQLSGDWRVGFLNNDFARSLTELENRIRAIPNLVVICASDVDQQSWVDPSECRTVFLHFLQRGLRGNATDSDRDGRIDAAELHAWVSRNVADWVAERRGVEQRPLLLPRGSAGHERAKQIDLTIARPSQETTSPALENIAASPQLRNAWQQYEQLLQKTPASFALSPTHWREYSDTLLRYEQLLRAGDRENAARMRQRLAGIEYRIQREQVQAPASLQNSLSLYAVTQAGELPRARALRVLNSLWSAEGGDRSQLWQTAMSAVDGEREDLQMLRLALFDVLLERATEDPAANLSRAAEIVEVARSPLYPLPAELHFLVMLNKYLPAEALAESNAYRIRRALQLRRLAERAAVGHHEGSVYSAEQSLPWIAAQIEAADKQRRQGEDLLFADAADQPQADAHFAAAEAGYERALDAAERVQNALATRDLVLARLPYYSRWLADATLDPLVANVRHEATLQDAEALWQQVHELANMLERPDFRWIVAVPPPTSQRPQPCSLADQADLVRANFDALVAEYEQLVGAIVSGDAMPHWHSVDRALRVPHGDWRLRLRLLAKAREGHRNTPASDADNVATAAPARTDAAEVTSHGTPSRTVTITNAHWQGRMALATLGRALFDQEKTGQRETFDQVQHRLNIFNVEQAWWRSSMAASEEIDVRYSALPHRIDSALRNIAPAHIAAMAQELADANRLARLISGAQANSLKSQPSLLQRRFQLQNLALFLADRTWADHWYSIDPQDEPYYRRAGLAYLNDAQRLIPNSPVATKQRDVIVADSKLRFTDLPRLNLTSQQHVSLDYQLQTEPGVRITTGYPVTWLTSGSGLELVQPIAGKRIVRHFDRKEQGGDVSIAIRSQPLDDAERVSVIQVARMNTELTLHGFFRGQVIEETVPVTLHLRPEIAQSRYPLPDAAAVSLSTTPSIANRFGTGDGAIALVLDCSGSMGPREGVNDPQQSKYAEAVAALREVLVQIPRNTSISLWTFGQADSSTSDRDSPEATIRRLQAPVAWNPGDPRQLRELMNKVDPRYVKPWNESPIVRTILAAKDDVAQAQGFKTILVITDGMDNRFAHDRNANASGKSIPQTLRAALANTGISLNIVAFKVAQGEEQKVQQQFSVVEELFPPGKFYQVDQTEALAETLARALGHRMRFQLHSYDRNQPPINIDIGRLDASQAWPLAPLSPGSYRLEASTSPPVGVDVSLNAGDVLALSLKQADGHFAVRRRRLHDLALEDYLTATAGSWQATLLQNRYSPAKQLQAALALENTSGDDASFVAQRTPRSVWFESIPQIGRQQGIAWRRLFGFAAPVWEISASEWPTTPDGQGLAKSRLAAWWSLDATTPFSATVKRSEQRPSAAELAGVALQSAEETVRIESVAIEDHTVEVSPDKRAKQSCLVVRMQSTPGNIYWAELIGLQTAGVEQRFYPSIGAYTGLYWPVTQSEVDRALQGLGIVSLDQFRREAETQGHHLQFDDLAAPDANSILPTPSFSLD